MKVNFNFNPKVSKKKAAVIFVAGAVATVAGIVAYKLINKKKEVSTTDNDLFTEDISEYFDFWEEDAIRAECKNIMKEVGDCGPFTVDLALSDVDDTEETDDFVVVRSKSGATYKINLMRTLGSHSYVCM